MNKLISIIIPNYNKEAFIEATLDSLVNQNYTRWEALIVDDGSSDQSLAKIDKYLDRDKRFKLLKRESEKPGASNCRNIGLKEAKGDFCIFLDSDDLLLPHCLGNRMALFLSHLELDFIVFPMGTFYETIGDNPMVWKRSRKSALDKFLSHTLPWTIVSPIWKTSFVKSINGFDTQYHRLQDVEFHTRALLKSNNYILSNDEYPDSYYRIGEERKSPETKAFYFNWVHSSELYIDTMRTLLQDSGLNSKIKLLKGTLIKTLTSILFAEKMGRISKEYSKELIERLYIKAKQHKWNKNYLLFYSFLYRAGLHRIKGFNFIVQNTYIYL